MLLSLSLRNIALIESLEIGFHQGLHVLSGETGAGKSIVVDAVNLALGGRAERDLIRNGTEKASVEAVFDIAGNQRAAEILNREGIDSDERFLTVYREISLSGRNICRICGVLTSLSLLRELSGTLMDIYGQHENRFLMSPDQHLRFLDQAGDSDFQELCRKTAEDSRLFLEKHREYAKLIKTKNQADVRMAELSKDLEELRKSRLKPDEEEKLTRQIRLLQNNEKITEGLRNVRQDLDAGERETGTVERIRDAADQLKRIVPYGEVFQKLADKTESLYYELEELSYEISRQLDQLEFDPAGLEKMEKRLDLIQRLKKKYGGSIREILGIQAALEREYEDLSGLDDRIADAVAEHKRLLAQYRGSAKKLTEARKQNAAHLEQRMMEELRELGMGNTRFQIAFSETADKKPKMPRAVGDDEVEFLISPNPGEPLKPLAKIASGGEMSRLMLALKNIEAGRTGIASMVFDEIDTGISGHIAQVVAEKMKKIAENKQVICVTHLPQIAAAGDYQYLVYKTTDGSRTRTTVEELDRHRRISEVARMISGAEGITSAAYEYAESMLSAYEVRHEEQTE